MVYYKCYILCWTQNTTALHGSTDIKETKLQNHVNTSSSLFLAAQYFSQIDATLDMKSALFSSYIVSIYISHSYFILISYL